MITPSKGEAFMRRLVLLMRRRLDVFECDGGMSGVFLNAFLLFVNLSVCRFLPHRHRAEWPYTIRIVPLHLPRLRLGDFNYFLKTMSIRTPYRWRKSILPCAMLRVVPDKAEFFCFRGRQVRWDSGGVAVEPIVLTRTRGGVTGLGLGTVGAAIAVHLKGWMRLRALV